MMQELLIESSWGSWVLKKRPLVSSITPSVTFVWNSMNCFAEALPDLIRRPNYLSLISKSIFSSILALIVSTYASTLTSVMLETAVLWSAWSSNAQLGHTSCLCSKHWYSTTFDGCLSHLISQFLAGSPS